eukprot:CAMPEP_0168614842 /NCGR_PEP_ID=MMETSP0449_2-20121227/4192_1 /TAXON_ID=1082188 /ORGANISM="Strombidium rassoulzadegani, Strain ras09" /LENGTH=187 /DNA_ID=CAMNT_0008655553 /DNA_START=16 /DNA_END=579 /DNA_ORIENTATION=+
MACYSNEVKHKCSKIVLIISVLIFILGILTVIMGVLQMGAGSEYTSEYANFDMQGGFAAGTLIGGVFAVIIGVLGVLTGKYKKFFFSCPFVVLASIFAILLFVAAAIMGGGEGALQDVIDQGCAQKWPNFDDKSTSELIGEQYLNLVDKIMCSEGCVCNEDYKNTWYAYSDTELRKNNRTTELTADE